MDKNKKFLIEANNFMLDFIILVKPYIYIVGITSFLILFFWKKYMKQMSDENKIKLQKNKIFKNIISLFIGFVFLFLVVFLSDISIFLWENSRSIWANMNTTIKLLFLFILLVILFITGLLKKLTISFIYYNRLSKENLSPFHYKLNVIVFVVSAVCLLFLLFI